MSNQDDSSDNNFPPYRKKQYGQGRGHGRGMGRGRGRGRGRPPVAYPIEVSRTASRKLGIITLTSFELKLLLLFTDGMVKLRDTKDHKKMAKLVLKLYKHKGLQNILDYTKKYQKKDNYQPEAIAIALEF